MLEHENEALKERVHGLERKVHEQNDEILCLRATLADVLRRLNSLESFTSKGRESPSGARGRRASPLRDREGISHPSTVFEEKGDASSLIDDSSKNDESRVTSPSQTETLSEGSCDSSNRERTSTGGSRIPTRTPVLHSSSILRESRTRLNSQDVRNGEPTPDRKSRRPHSTIITKRSSHQSTGSLFDNDNCPIHYKPITSPKKQMSSLSSRAYDFQSPTSASMHKRWSSSSDFSAQGIMGSSNSLKRLGSTNSGSLTNLTKWSSGMQKPGLRDASFNEEDGYIKFYLRGRPIVLYVPSHLIESYSLSTVTPGPQSRLKLEWAYGYRGKDCRSNLYLLPTGEIVYFIAAVVVLYNVEEQTQRHYLGHTDDVKCLCIHPNKLLIATGQTAGHDKMEGKPHIRIWNSVSLSTLHVLGLGEFERSITAISFSKADGGGLLAAIDEANDHVLSLWEWQKGETGHKITETKCSADTVIGVDFHPMDRHTVVTCGKNHIAFWNIEGGTLSRRLGIFESRDKPKYVTCIAFADNGDVISGDSNGNILVWGRGTNTILKSIKNAHEGAVFSLLVLKDGHVVSGGGKDGQLTLWDPSYRRTGYTAEVPEQYGNCRTIAEGKGSQLLVGTTKNAILAGSFELPFSVIMSGHIEELWALVSHPTEPQFVTGAFDGTITMWDSMSKTVVWTLDNGEPVQSLDISPDGSSVAVGTTTGKWQLLDMYTREELVQHTDGSEPIQVIRFSPDGKTLAIGSRDNHIYLYQLNDDYKKANRVGRCTGHSSFITQLDWSEDGSAIRSNSGDHDVLFWNPNTCRQILQPSQLKDVQWATDTCRISFNSVGIWPEGADGTDINNCARSHDGSLLVTGDDFGTVRLYQFPASNIKSIGHIYGGHSSHVTNVAFMHEDNRVISIGGKDMSVLQWKVLNQKNRFDD
ncbi:hypothetical protein QYM36_015714 [Artemia franciscana]|nr:hypothetical protein QYM36_015714 [Artemia franciscana]